MKKNKQGFTLIELLVVIAIIGLLSTLSIVALNQARARSRDARRVADVKQIQTALEMYYNDNFTYPTTASGSIATTVNGVLTTYMDIVPKSPLPADGSCPTAAFYTYANASSSTYTLQYCLGAPTGGIKAGLNVASPAGIAQSSQIQ